MSGAVQSELLILRQDARGTPTLLLAVEGDDEVWALVGEILARRRLLRRGDPALAVHQGLDLPQVLAQSLDIRCGPDDPAAAGADHLILTFQPGQALQGLVAAMRAADQQRPAVEIAGDAARQGIAHGVSP